MVCMVFQKIERLVDKIIPFLVVILLVMIVLELMNKLHQFDPWPSVIDSVIVAVFVIELCFKWMRVRNVKMFVKLYWLDILAVFPFYLIFRVYEFARAAETAQQVFHEAELLRSEAVVKEIAREEKLVKEARLVPRLLRVFQRSLRLIAARLHVAHKRMVKVHYENKE